MTTVTDPSGAHDVYYNKSGKTIQRLIVVDGDPVLSPEFLSQVSILYVTTISPTQDTDSGINIPAGCDVGDEFIIIHAGKDGAPGVQGATFTLYPATGEELLFYPDWGIRAGDILTFTKISDTQWFTTAK